MKVSTVINKIDRIQEIINKFTIHMTDNYEGTTDADYFKYIIEEHHLTYGDVVDIVVILREVIDNYKDMDIKEQKE